MLCFVCIQPLAVRPRTAFSPFCLVLSRGMVVIVNAIVVIDRSRVHVHMPMSYRASKGTPIAPQHTPNNGCKSWGLVDRFGGV